MERHGHICAWKSHSTYTYGEQKSNREIGSKKTSRRLLLSGVNRRTQEGFFKYEGSTINRIGFKD